MRKRGEKEKGTGTGKRRTGSSGFGKSVHPERILITPKCTGIALNVCHIAYEHNCMAYA